MLDFYIIMVITIALLAVSIYWIIKEIYQNTWAVTSSILLCTALLVGGSVFSNLICTFVLNIIIANKFQHEADCKKAIIIYKLKKYNKNVKDHNEKNKISLTGKIKIIKKYNNKTKKINIPVKSDIKIPELNFNESFFNIYNQNEKSKWQILIYCIFNIPILIWEVYLKFSGKTEPEGGIFNNWDYYEKKLEFCFVIFFIIEIIYIYIICKWKKDNHVIVNSVYKNRIKNIQNAQIYDTCNIDDDNSKILSSDNEKVFLIDYTEEELQILNKIKSI